MDDKTYQQYKSDIADLWNYRNISVVPDTTGNEYETAIRNFRDHWDRLGKRGYQPVTYVLPKWAIALLRDYWDKSDIEPITDIRDSSAVWHPTGEPVKSDIWNKEPR